MVEAGAFPETFFTVWHNVFERGALKAGETMLLHRRLVRHRHHGDHAGQVPWRARHRHRRFGGEGRACRKLGADVAINYNTQDFVAETKKATGNKGAELIVDMVAGDYIQKNYDAAAMDGRIVQIAFHQPSKATANFTKLMVPSRRSVMA